MQNSPAYRVTVADFGGARSTRTLTPAEGDILIDSALCDGDDVVPDADRSGRITITRTIRGRLSAVDAELRTLRRVVRLEPVCGPRLVTARQYDDLTLIHDRDAPGKFPARLVEGRLRAGFAVISPAATARLFGRGWLTSHTDGAITVSYAGRVAMALHEHRNEIVFIGTHRWVQRSDGTGGYEPGMPLYRAGCSCGHRAATRFEERACAQAACRRHRLNHLRAVFGLAP
ncbi:hypothetical protein [Streptomyces sp. NPDC047315]|uniref:hypothetical protein n=1 Tax=Streptomyces sp. NPDC047315 TaxID=3155142 RepID=UPI0033DCA100